MARRSRRAWAWLRRNALPIYAGLAVAYMLIPIVVIAVFSFGDDAERQTHLRPRQRLHAPSTGRTAFSLPELNEALFTSLRLAALSTAISTAIGTLMAIALVRHRFHGRRAANLLIVIPMATPEVVIGASLLSMFIYYTFALGFTTLLIAHVMFSISFVVVVVRSRLIGFDRHLEEAAADLGATPLATFRTVTLPLLAPGIIAAALLAFALSIDDFVISNFNSGTTVTFPLYVYGVSLRGIPVQVNALATMLFAVTVIAVRAGALAAAPRRADGGGAARTGSRPRHAAAAPSEHGRPSAPQLAQLRRRRLAAGRRGRHARRRRPGHRRGRRRWCRSRGADAGARGGRSGAGGAARLARGAAAAAGAGGAGAARGAAERRREELVALVTADMGKTLADADGEVGRGIESVESAAAIPHLLKGETLEGVAAGVDVEMVRQPVGVVAAITPFNFPAMIPLWFLPYAIACGNSFLLKPSEQDPRPAALIVEIVDSIEEIPPGVVNLVHGGRDAVTAILADPGIDAISFVGRAETARIVAEGAVATGKRVQALGGAKNSLVVMPDADLEQAMPAIMGSAFGAAGQRCLAGSVCVVVGDEARRAEVREALVAGRLGADRSGPATIPPPTSARWSRPTAREKVAEAIGRAGADGAELLLDGRGDAGSGGHPARPDDRRRSRTPSPSWPGTSSSARC